MTMELAFLLILGIVSSVTCSPHGYGAQSGAVAKAGAVAFAGVPNLPALKDAGASSGAGSLGGSYSSSGSFSKSSASSFASSSASSYSFSGAGGYQGTKDTGSFPVSGQGAPITSPSGYAQSGTGASSVAGAGTATGAGSYPGYPSNGNCGSAGCDNSDNKQGQSGNKITSSFNNGQSASGAASDANSFTGSAANCGGSKCDTPVSENKCTSGNCGQNVPSPSNDNDIVVTAPSYAGTKTSYDADAQSPFINTKKPSGCSGGDCNTFGANTYNNANSGAQAQGNNECSGANCNAYPFNSGPSGNSRPSFNPPSTYLTAPKDTKPEPCSSGNCGNPTNPSNYYPVQPTSCNTPNCGSHIASGVTSTSNSGSSSNTEGGSYSSNYNPQGTKCTSPNCGSAPEPSFSNNYPQVPKCTTPNCDAPNQNSPNYPNKPHTPQNFDQGQYKPVNCGSPNCGGLAGTQSSAGTSIPVGHYGNKPNYDYPSKQPSYTGGFGAPSGVLSPTKPSYSQPQAPIQPTFPSQYPSAPAPSHTSHQSPNNQPAYSGGFGGPSGILKPNEHSLPASPNFNQPKPTVPSSFPSKPPTPNSNTPTNDEELNFVPLKPNKQSSGATNNANFHNQAGSSAFAAAGASAGVYSGGFGGPPGFLKPYDNGDKGASFTHKYNKPGYAGQGNAINNNNALSGNNYNSAAGSSAGAFAGAGAVAGAGGLGTGGYYDKQHSQDNSGNAGIAHGCTGGCRPAAGYNGNTGFNLGGSFGLSKTGLLEGLAGGLHAAGAAAKGIAGAIGSAGAGAGSLGLSGSFAGSAATAHASSGSYAGK